MNKSKKSAMLTKTITIILCVLLTVLMIAAYPALKWYYGDDIYNRIIPTLVSFYLCSPAAFITLLSILRLMKNIINEDIFNKTTVKIMKILSYCCLYVAIICIIGGFFSPALLIFGTGSAFMMLILRVLKNVMETATEIKSENELTI